MGLDEDGIEAPQELEMEAPPEPPDLPDLEPEDLAPVDALTDVLEAEDHTTPPPGGEPTGELGDAPPVPAGAGGGGDGGQSVIGGPPAPVIDLGGTGPEGAADAGATGDDGTAPPPLPAGIDPTGGGQSPFGAQPGLGAPADTTGSTVDTGPDDSGTPHAGGDAAPEPPGTPTGVQGDPPPVPDDLDPTGGGQSPFDGQPGLGETAATPATLSSDAATQLLTGMIPGMAPEAVEVAVLGAADDGQIDVGEVINLLHAHGTEAELTTGTSVAELLSGAETVHLVGTIDGAPVPLVVEHVDHPSGMLICRDGSGAQFEGRVEDIDRVWKASGAPVISVQSSPSPGAGAPSLAAPAGEAPPAVAPLDTLPTSASDSGEGGGLGGALAIGAVAMIPVAIGGGILARRLTRRS